MDGRLSTIEALRGAILSPCNEVCRIDASTRLCVGCGRSIEEIGSWASFSPVERRRIMSELAGRKPWSTGEAR